MPGLDNVREIEVATPFGEPSDTIVVGELEGIAVAFLPRHGRGHILTPTEVPYQANIYAMKQLGVENLISVSACGSLRESLCPGDVVIPDQVFDFTKLRKSSFFGEGQVAHISSADPYCPDLSELLAEALVEAGGQVHRGGAFIAMEGPRYSTKAESRVFRQWGMDIIGMTVCPEVFHAREAGICYATMAHITDYDVWHESEETVTLEMVIRQLNENVSLAQDAIRRLVARLDRRERDCACREALATAMISDPARVPEATKAKTSLLIDSPDNAS
jgi:5'-methylthioadenosine phosphorylase